MLIRETRRLVFIILPLLVFSLISWKLYSNEPIQVPSRVSDWIDKQFDKNYPPPLLDQDKKKESSSTAGKYEENKPFAPIPELNVSPIPPTTGQDQPVAPISPILPEKPAVVANPPAATNSPAITTPAIVPQKLEDTHDILYSLSTPDKKYFKVKMGDQAIMNPNIIPHPSIPNTWIVVAQQDGTGNADSRYFTELFCNAQFGFDGTLVCINEPTVLPVEATTSDKCTGKLSFAAFNIGPHDARVFYGPSVPYTIYGSQSSYACFGLWAQDLRDLIQWGPDLIEHKVFSKGTEIQRPPPWGVMEKNFFLFWDEQENMYAHYDITPKRVFAKIEADGSAGPDLAPAAAAKDDQCLAKYLPKLAPELESIHQATNSLSVTMCNRADPSCVPSDDNTFLFTIYQHKSFHYLHALYEPYVMVYKRKAPFEIYGMSQKPLWVNGRVQPEVKSGTDGHDHVAGQEMVYVVSMSWKKVGQRYHGFQDDELFLSFGIEDHYAGGIDIRASDLFKGLGKCD